MLNWLTAKSAPMKGNGDSAFLDASGRVGMSSRLRRTRTASRNVVQIIELGILYIFSEENPAIGSLLAALTLTVSNSKQSILKDTWAMKITLFASLLLTFGACSIDFSRESEQPAVGAGKRAF